MSRTPLLKQTFIPATNVCSRAAAKPWECPQRKQRNKDATALVSLAKVQVDYTTYSSCAVRKALLQHRYLRYTDIFNTMTSTWVGLISYPSMQTVTERTLRAAVRCSKQRRKGPQSRDMEVRYGNRPYLSIPLRMLFLGCHLRLNQFMLGYLYSASRSTIQRFPTLGAPASVRYGDYHQVTLRHNATCK